MVLTRDFDLLVNQNFHVLTDIEVTFGLPCLYTATLTTAPAYVSLLVEKIIADA